MKGRSMKTIDNAFVKLKRTPEVLDLMERRSSAFLLLSLIAMRARRTTSIFGGLHSGQALVGDFKSYGVTRKVYRNDLVFLERHNLITVKRASKGTIVTLCPNAIFDINPEIEGTSKGHQGATNKNVKNERMESKSESLGLGFSSGEENQSKNTTEQQHVEETTRRMLGNSINPIVLESSTTQNPTGEQGVPDEYVMPLNEYSYEEQNALSNVEFRKAEMAQDYLDKLKKEEEEDSGELPF